MYRGSRLAASFLLVLTGLAALATALFVVPAAVGAGGGGWLTPVVLFLAILHFAALVGIYRGRDWGRNLAVFVAELGGGIAILGAISLLTGARPFGADSATGPRPHRLVRGRLCAAGHRRGPDPGPGAADPDRASPGRLRPELRRAAPAEAPAAAGT